MGVSAYRQRVSAGIESFSPIAMGLWMKLGLAALRRSETRNGLGFFFLWAVVGSAVTIGTLGIFFPYLIGGYGEPPRIFWICLNLGFTAMPILLIFGGLPAAIQMIRGRPWQTAALASFALCITTWAALTFVVVFGPSIWGWTW